MFQIPSRDASKQLESLQGLVTTAYRVNKTRECIGTRIGNVDELI